MPSHSQVHKVRKLVLTKATGVCAGEATSQMQLNWRRVKKEYFSVYLFRSAVTANAVSPVRRTTTVLKAMQMRFGRYRACRAGLTERQLAALEARLESHGYVRLRDTVYKSWKEMHDACEKVLAGGKYKPLQNVNDPDGGDATGCCLGESSSRHPGSRLLQDSSAHDGPVANGKRRNYNSLSGRSLIRFNEWTNRVAPLTDR